MQSRETRSPSADVALRRTPWQVESGRAQKKGDITEVKALMRHPMETGMRKDQAGDPILRTLLLRYRCSMVTSL